MWSVAYGPDGTLFALTARGELWAYPAGGERLLVAHRTEDYRMEGWIDVSPEPSLFLQVVPVQILTLGPKLTLVSIVLPEL